MNKEKLIPIFVISILLLSSVVFAAGTISITGITIPSSVTQGDSFTITMSVSGSQVTDVYGSLTLPSGLSCTPTGSQLISLGVDTSWSCTADVAGDYSNKITASVTAKDSGTGASLSDNMQTGLKVLSPASITISSTISDSSITTAGSTTFTVGVNNIGDVATTFNITLLPSGVTFDLSSHPNTNIDGNSLKNIAFTVSSTTVETYTLIATVSAATDQVLNTSKSLTVTTITDGTTGTTGTTGGISTTARPYITLKKGKVNITVSSIVTGGKMIATIARYEDVAIRAMNITVVNNVANIKIMISKLSILPSTVPYDIEGKIYHYINIERINITDSDINTVNIEFAVNKTWLTDNNVDASNITLYRWSNNQWNALGATKIAESDKEVFYNSNSPGLSVFIIGTKGGAPEPPEEEEECEESWSCTGWSECVDGTQTRTCTDANNCGTTVNKPVESQACEVEKAIIGITTISILTNVIIIVVAVIICVFIFLERVKITSYLEKIAKKPEKTKL